MNTIDATNGRFRHDNVILLWIVFFCYSIYAALFFQKLLLPLIPSLHAGNGLMHNDAILFHSEAIEMAKSIKLNGWSSWTIWPGKYFAGNVAILSVLYALFGYDPALIVPVNALFHATGGILIYLLGRELWPGRVGNIGGMIAASLFIVFPSALNWYGQLHKDGYAIAGVLLILFSWVWALGRQATLKTGIWLIVGTTAGIFLVALVRPYELKLLFCAGLLLFVLLIFYILFSSIFRVRRMLICYFLAALIVLGIGAKYIQPSGVSLAGMRYADWSDREKEWAWQNNYFLPDLVENYIEVAARTRAGMIRYNIDMNAGSLLDEDVAPMNVSSVAAYMPRALQISLFAPFPASWFQKLSMMRLVSIFEMVIWYILFPGVLLTLYYRRSPSMLIVIVFCLFFLSVLGFVSPNVGTLYRLRYGFLSVFMLIGVMGWIHFSLTRFGIFKRHTPAPVQDSIMKELDLPQGEYMSNTLFQSRTTVAGTSMMVAFLTFMFYIGLFIRDLIMARRFGLGSEIDTFFIGSMVPMFLVTVLSIPLGAAIVPLFLEMKEKYSKNTNQDFVTNVAFAITGLLALMCIALYLASSSVLPVIGWRFTPDKIEGSFIIMVLFLPILLLSGLIITANSILNTLGKFLLPGLAQLVVPLAAIFMIVVFSDSFGIMAVAVGMLVGQVLNLLLIGRYLWGNGFSIFPRLTRNYKLVFPLFQQYVPLVAASFFVSATIPLGNAMASSLPEGSVATFGIGMKIVTFVTGIVGIGIATVMVPYFSQFMTRKQYGEASRNLSFFLFLVTVITIPIAVLLYLTSADIIRFAFEGGALQRGDTLAIARLMRFGIIQIPFLTCGILITRFAIANRRANLVLIASGIGLGLNIPLNLLLMRHIGVAGIALATTLSIAVSTSLLLLIMHRSGHISWFEAVLLIVNWLLYLTLITCLYYLSYAGIFVVALAYVSLIVGHRRILFPSQRFVPSIT